MPPSTTGGDVANCGEFCLDEFFPAWANGNDFLIVVGDKPHWAEEQCAEAFFAAVEELGVERVTVVVGVHRSMQCD